TPNPSGFGGNLNSNPAGFPRFPAPPPAPSSSIRPALNQFGMQSPSGSAQQMGMAKAQSGTGSMDLSAFDSLVKFPPGGASVGQKSSNMGQPKLKEKDPFDDLLR